MKTLSVVLLAVVVGLSAWGCRGWLAEVQEPEPPKNELAQVLASLPKDKEYEIIIEDGEVGTETYYSGGSVQASDDYAGTRILSWFGLSPNEVVSKKQGIQVDGVLKAGQAKGYGLAETLWNRIKSFFWFLVLGLVGLVVLSFIPATASVGRAILRGLAALIPAVGSLVERGIAAVQIKKTEAVTQNVVDSVQAGREVLKDSHPVAAEEFDNKLKEIQDKETKLVVAEYKLPG